MREVGDRCHPRLPAVEFIRIPPREVRESLQPGDLAKLIFRISVRRRRTHVGASSRAHPRWLSRHLGQRWHGGSQLLKINVIGYAIYSDTCINRTMSHNHASALQRPQSLHLSVDFR